MNADLPEGETGLDNSVYLLDLSRCTDYEDILPRDNYNSPFYINVPVPDPLHDKNLGGASDLNPSKGHPIPIFVDRFQKWRKILKSLIDYFREVAHAHEEYAKINSHLKSSVKFSLLADIDGSSNSVTSPSAAPTSFTPSAAAKNGRDGYFQDVDSNGFVGYGSGSVQDIQVLLKRHHAALANEQLRISKELLTVIIPKMEDLRRDLQGKIKEIRELARDFKTNIHEHVALTGQLLRKYIASVNFLTESGDGTLLKAKHDPYLLKLQLDLQLKRQLQEDNCLHEAYINLQSSGMALERIVYEQIQQVLEKYASCLESESCVVLKTLSEELGNGILSKSPTLEWDEFVNRNTDSLLNWKSSDPVPEPRKLSSIRYPNMKSPLAKCIRAGYLSKKSKYLKNYNRGYFVLTSNYLHEFKSSEFIKVLCENDDIASLKNVNLTPLISIPLNDSVLVEAQPDKFILSGMFTSNDSQDSIQEESLYSISSASTHSSTGKPGSGFGKLLKPLSTTVTKLTTATLQQHGADYSKHNTWTFKPVNDQSLKEFRKWSNELKLFSNFNTTLERAKYIEEKLMITSARNYITAPTIKINAPTSPTETTGFSESTESFKKPQKIDISGTGGVIDMLSMKSLVNTPAIDDNGNLIMAGDIQSTPGPPMASPAGSFSSASTGSNVTLSKSLQLPHRSGASTSTHRSLDALAGAGGYFAIPINRQSSSTELSSMSKTLVPPTVSQPEKERSALRPPMLDNHLSSPSIDTLQRPFKHKKNSSFHSLTKMFSK
ncbi:HDL056Wp [Eremothecium sinecaudum]|uniref:HDL056Wp n=1 Tax=Eremothecium sinecaudum TaxID=45286 RepID=A0A120K277_9SACH|nr:HDL056Wp [Eremothecium sinecaudum]AMD20688.1 HDL056Wp [Eremothecium sinecaudum]